MAKLVFMLRVKDGMFFLKEWLDRNEVIADEIVALDNGSTDGTYEMLKAHPKVVELIRTQGYDEGRDKNLLYQSVINRKADWCLWTDVDEIFEAGLTRKHFDKLMRSRSFNKFSFRRFHFIDREGFAVSPYWLNYSSGHDRVLWRVLPGGFFENVLMDSPNVKGIRGFTLGTNFRLKHLGYINKSIVDKKADQYRGMTNGEKEQNISSMYLQNEKRMVWSDDRKSSGVILLNWKLNIIMLKHKIPAAFRKAGHLISNRTKKLNTSMGSLFS